MSRTLLRNGSNPSGSFVAWLAILFTGHYPEGLYQFGVGVLRWFIRVEAYLLLLVDEYPPFSFE